MDSLDFSFLCRICLTKTSQMLHLKDHFTDVINENKVNLPILKMLTNVLNLKPNLSGSYPQYICSMCLDVLRTAYHFKILFEESNQILEQCLGSTKDSPNKSFDNSNELKASVELIAGSNKYDLKELVIVEDEDYGIEEGTFQGFLKNLGNSVSITFVKNTSTKKYSSMKLGSNKKANSNYSSTTLAVIRNSLNCLDEYILTDDKTLKNCNEKEKKYSEEEMKGLETLDKDLLNSALKLKYSCSFCKKKFVTESRYMRHCKLCVRKHSTYNKKYSLKCNYCARTFKDAKYLKYHINVTHIKSRVFPCEICNVNFKTKRAFSYHRLSKHSDAKHICQYCGKSFAITATLKLHLQIHTNRNTTQCICPVCGKTFHYKGGLFYHMKLHNNDRKYHCDYCDKKFYTLFAKQRHVRTHTGIRPYQCRYCDKTFFSLGERKKHEQIHTGTLPYHCQYCEKGFRSKYNLKVHCFNHKGDFRCQMCKKRFIDNDVLQFHYKIKHKEVTVDGSH